MELNTLPMVLMAACLCFSSRFGYFVYHLVVGSADWTASQFWSSNITRYPAPRKSLAKRTD